MASERSKKPQQPTNANLQKAISTGSANIYLEVCNLYGKDEFMFLKAEVFASQNSERQ